MCESVCVRERDIKVVVVKRVWSAPLSLDVVHGLDVFSGHLDIADASAAATSLFQSKLKET